MLMMRLQRVGRRNDPSYRVVVTDKRTGPKSNKHVALLGSYNTKLDHVQLDTEAVKKWLAQGVQPSPTVHNLLVSQGVIEAKKINVLPKKTVPIKEETLVESADSNEVDESEDSATDEVSPESANEPEEGKNEEVEESEVAKEDPVIDETEGEAKTEEEEKIAA